MEIKYRPDDFEIKIMLLYIVNNLKTNATYTLLDYIVKDTTELNYFELQKYLNNLVESNDLKELKTNDGIIYSLTNSGSETVGFFADKLPFTIREALTQKVRLVNKKQNAGNEISADFYPVSSNEFALKFTVKESSVPLLKLDFYVGSKERAKKAAAYFNENAAQMYSEIANFLNEKIK